MTRRFLLAAVLITLAGLTGWGGCSKQPLEGHTVNWLPWDSIQPFFPTYERPIFLYISQARCPHCDSMEIIFNRPEIAWYLNEHFASTEINVDADMPVQIMDTTLPYRAFWQYFGLKGVPAYYFFDTTGNPIGILQGQTQVREFKQLLTYVSARHFGRIPWTEWAKTEEAQVDTLIGFW